MSEQTERLIIVRERLGYSVKEFAEKIPMSERSYRNIEAGSDKINDNFLKKLKRNLNINPEWILYGRGEMVSSEAKQIDHSLDISEVREPEQSGYDKGPNILSDHEIISRLVLQNEKLIQIIERHSITIENLSARNTGIAKIKEPKKV